MLSYMLRAPYMLEVPKYKIKIISNTMGVDFKGFDQVEVHPIEWDGMLLFSDGKKDSTRKFTVHAGDIVELSKSTETKGKILKKEDLAVEIIFKLAFTDDSTNTHKIKVNLEDEYVDEFIKQVALVRENAMDSEYWTCKKIKCLGLVDDNDGDQKELEIFPNTPFLNDYEKIVWYNTETGGENKKKDKLRSLEVITNFRAFEYDFEHHVGNGILIPLIKDLKIENGHLTDVPNPIGNYTDYYESIADKTRKVSNLQAADIVFITEGKPTITFNEIGDPDRLVTIIEYIIQQGNIKLIDDEIHTINDEVPSNEISAITDKEIRVDTEQPVPLTNPFLGRFYHVGLDANSYGGGRAAATTENGSSLTKKSNMNCGQCGNSNPESSKFCNNCGAELDANCPQCGNANPEGSKFCNSCGYDLLLEKNIPNINRADTGILDEISIEFETCELFEYGMRISFPMDWTKYDHGIEPPNIAYFQPQNENTTDELDGVAISVTPVSASETLENVLNLYIDNLRVYSNDFFLEESKKVTLSNEPAYRLVYRESGFKSLAVLTLRQNDGSSSVINLLYSASQSSYDRFLTVANKMIQSFELTD